MPSLTLDRMRPEDLDEVLTIERASFTMPWSRGAFLYEMQQNRVARCWVMRQDDGRVIAYLCLWEVADEMHVTNVAVRPDARRQGIARTLILEVTSLSPETQEPFAQTGLIAFATIAQYLQSQMEAGRLRTMPPILALQSLVGSVMLHLLSAPVLSRSMSGIPSGEEAVLQLTQLWLRGMRPQS